MHDANLPYMNPKLPPEQQAADLVRRMTLVEKASMSHKFSRRVNCAKAMKRNCSAQLRLRTRKSPLYRTTLRENEVQVRNSINCANTTLTVFTAAYRVNQSLETASPYIQINTTIK